MSFRGNRAPRGFRGRSRFKYKRPNDEQDSSQERNGKHPPHLRGRDIGLFYANRNKQFREGRKNETPKPIGTILLSDCKKQQIMSLLNADDIKSKLQKDSSYNYVQDSKFKRSFLKVINEDIQERLQSNTPIEQTVNLDEKYFNEHLEKQTNLRYLQMMSKRKKLPSYDMKDEIVSIIEENQVCVVSGETGCGKTTQVSQFILDDYIANKKGSLCRIVCTQPRRISAITVAERVAEERAEKLGESTGYQIRLEKMMPREKCSIIFCTTGVILRQMETDPCLSNVSHLILDEIHERDIMSDFLISLMKKVVSQRKDMKLILMSATLNSERFAQYYGDCKIIHIPGFTHHVEEYFLEDVLQRTRFSFDEFDCGSRPNFVKFKNMKKNKIKMGEYSNMIEPHIRQLEAEKKYSKHVTTQLRDPRCEELNLELILALLIHICTVEEESGAILVFLTGYAEISKLNTLMETSGKFPRFEYLILPLHSQMPTVSQRQIFDTPPNGVRKIILSTNIAETSITIDDVVFVVDCGKIKMTNLDPETNNQTLLPEWVTLANANQRRGRAGRVKPGICFHMYSRVRGMLLELYQKPEILRKRLEDVILMIKMLQLGKAEEFLSSLMDQPDAITLERSIELLKRLNALDEDECLTPLGYHLAKLPVSPQMGKMILLGAIFSCLDPVLSVAVTLGFKDAFLMPLGKEGEVDRRKLELANGMKSDHLLFHEALRGFENAGNNARSFCHEYFLSFHTLTLLQNMKKQFTEYLHDMDFVPNRDPKCNDCNRNSDNMSLVKAIICAGLYPNVVVCKQLKYRNAFHTINRERVSLHPKSILSKETSFESPLCVYYLRLKSSSDFLHDATMVHPLPLIFFGDRFAQHKEMGISSISIDDKLRFKCSESTTEIIIELRNRLNWFLEYKVSHPGFVDWTTGSNEIKILLAIMELITSEDVGDLDLDAYDDFD